MNKSFEDERKRREQANNFKEENELEKLKRHKELIEAITGKPYTGKATATKVTQDSGGSLLESLLRYMFCSTTGSSNCLPVIFSRMAEPVAHPDNRITIDNDMIVNFMIYP
jgi:hypothetical protein